jgi:hypothetical protein
MFTSQFLCSIRLPRVSRAIGSRQGMCFNAPIFQDAVPFKTTVLDNKLIFFRSPQKAKVDLPKDEPAIIKLFILYLHEGEYEPKLPDGNITDAIGCDSYLKVYITTAYT